MSGAPSTDGLPTMGVLFLWISADSTRVLGASPVSAEDAYRTAGKKHPGKTDGYPTRLVLDHFPAGGNPFIAIGAALLKAMEAPNTSPQVEGSTPQTPRLADEASDPEPKAIGTIGIGKKVK